ncbi:MAG: prepilin-type N-terminal cleavage/methylation domain-containing protein [Acidobacteria bacterium]|jgi:Tfp pilus assembly protein PilV|nr:prepilin-type N-terminal cleavage/methylation domain-containing protein [Acidobacteriota bacterium]
MRRNRLGSESGVTLVEALVAVGIFGIALLGLNMLLISTIKTSQFTKDYATARFLAGHRLEQIKNSRYQDGDRDAYRDPTDPCTDIDEVTTSIFPDEDYGEVDLLNGTRFNYRNCANVPDIKLSSIMVTSATYSAGQQGRHDFAVNSAQYGRFRREVYVVDAADYAQAITNVRLGPANPDARDSVIVDTTAPTADQPASRYVKYVIVRVKWKDLNGKLHHVTLSSEKAFYIPSF